MDRKINIRSDSYQCGRKPKSLGNSKKVKNTASWHIERIMNLEKLRKRALKSRFILGRGAVGEVTVGEARISVLHANI